MSDTVEFEKMAQELISSAKGMNIGPTFLAICFDSLLMGIIICQMVSWLPRAGHDARHVRILVGCASTAALLATIFTWATSMHPFVYNFGTYADFASLEYSKWYGVLDILLVVPVQIFFAERSVRINNNNKTLMAINAMMITATACLATSATITMTGQNAFTKTTTVAMLQIAWLSVCTANHVWLTSTILFGLHRTRSQFEATNKLLVKLTVLSIESQLPSTIVAVSALMCIIVNNKSPLAPLIVIVHPKVFCVGLLAMVNLRHTWRSSRRPVTSYGTDLSQRGNTHISLGCTVEDFGLQTPRADVESSVQLSRQQSGHSMMESGYPLKELKSEGDVDHWISQHLYK